MKEGKWICSRAPFVELLDECELEKMQILPAR